MTFLALVCLVVGAALTPIVSSQAGSKKGKKGSSCQNPYRTIIADGSHTGDLGVVRSSIKIRYLSSSVSEVTLTVKPRPGFRICKVFLKHSGKSKTAVSFPSQGGTKTWTRDISKQRVKNILGIQVYSRSR